MRGDQLCVPAHGGWVVGSEEEEGGSWRERGDYEKAGETLFGGLFIARRKT